MFGAIVGYFDANYLAELPPELRAKVLHARVMERIRDKETNMRNRLERRRHAIWWKWCARLFWFAIGMVAAPLFIVLVTWCWLQVLN